MLSDRTYNVLPIRDCNSESELLCTAVLLGFGTGAARRWRPLDEGYTTQKTARGHVLTVHRRMLSHTRCRLRSRLTHSISFASQHWHTMDVEGGRDRPVNKGCEEVNQPAFCYKTA